MRSLCGSLRSKCAQECQEFQYEACTMMGRHWKLCGKPKCGRLWTAIGFKGFGHRFACVYYLCHLRDTWELLCVVCNPNPAVLGT